VSAAEAALGCRLRQYHVGLVCWTAAVDSLSRLEHAISHVAAEMAASGDPVFLPCDESSAWAWLPLGIRDRFDAGRSYKAAAERLTLHKNTVQYRIGKAEESLGRSAGENRQDVELALRASHWLGSSVLQPERQRPVRHRGG
jgi:PucR-like helix-turn-helix protein